MFRTRVGLGPAIGRCTREDGVVTTLVLFSRCHVDLLRVSSCLCHG
ncbi:hypothetical protein AB0G64_33260 [Streptomyces longwoodensis]